MKRQSEFIYNITGILFAFFLLSGCGKEEPPKPKVIITKKIIFEKNAVSQARQQQAKPDAGEQPKIPVKDQKTDKVGKSPEKAVAEKKKEIPAQKPEKPDKPEKSDKKEEKPKSSEPLKPVAEKPPEKIPEKKPKSPEPLKPAEKPPEKAVAKTEPAGKKLSEKKSEPVVPDVSALQKEVDKAVMEKAVAAYEPSKEITDPFAPLFKEEPKPKAKPGPAGKEATRVLGPLEKLDLSQLKLVGIIRSISGPPRALVEEAGGKGYIIRKGTYIGIHSGKVSEITEDKIIIEEQYEDYVGNELDGWERTVTVRKREMKLQKAAGDDL